MLSLYFICSRVQADTHTHAHRTAIGDTTKIKGNIMNGILMMKAIIELTLCLAVAFACTSHGNTLTHTGEAIIFYSFSRFSRHSTRFLAAPLASQSTKRWWNEVNKIPWEQQQQQYRPRKLWLFAPCLCDFYFSLTPFLSSPAVLFLFCCPFLNGQSLSFSFAHSKFMDRWMGPFFAIFPLARFIVLLVNFYDYRLFFTPLL